MTLQVQAQLHARCKTMRRRGVEGAGAGAGGGVEEAGVGAEAAVWMRLSKRVWKKMLQQPLE